MVGMPLFAEQPDNIARAMDRGYALATSVKKLNTLAADLENALRRVLTEPSFAASAARVSHKMKAHRQTPAQIAAGEIVRNRLYLGCKPDMMPDLSKVL